jgi:hypothetical protein
VGLWLIIRGVRRDLHDEDPNEVRRLTLKLVRDLLARGDVVAGYYPPVGSGISAGRIVPWTGTIDEIVARINKEWDELGREPNIAEIVIFVMEDSWLVWDPIQGDCPPPLAPKPGQRT